jgi:signal transduction histidine kinase
MKSALKLCLSIVLCSATLLYLIPTSFAHSDKLSIDSTQILESKIIDDSIRHGQKQLYSEISLDDEKSEKIYWIIGFGGALLCGLVIFLWVRYKSRKELAQVELNRKIDMINSLIKGQEDERKRISQDLHDGIGAELIAAKLMMSSGNMEEAYRIVEKTIGEIRDLSHDLTPPKLERESIEKLLKSYIDTVSSGLSFKIHLSTTGSFEKLNPNQKISIYRIAQECISNAIKYAQASEQTIQLFEDDNVCTLMIEDDGVGFDVDQKSNGIGVSNIKSRVESLNGTLSLDSTIGHGTTTIVEFQIN